LFGAGYSQQTFVQQHGQLRVVGTHLVDKNGTRITLRGMAMYHSIDAGKYYTDSVVKWLRDDWRCTVLRGSIWAADYPNENSKAIALADAAIKYGIYVIIDWHVVGASNETNALAFFDTMAKKYANIPNIIYEPWNEPVDGTWTANLKPYFETVIAKIRQYDSANVIVCGTTYWSKNVDEASLNPIKDYKNIAYTLHWYAFQDFQSLRDKATTAMKNGICVFATECGVANFNQSPCLSDGSGLDFAEGQTWFNFCNDSGISTATWSVHDKDECTSVLKPGTDPSGLGNWPISSLTTSGVWMRNYLRSQNATSVSNENHGQAPKGGVVFSNHSDGLVNSVRFSYSYPKSTELRFDIYNSAGCKVTSRGIQLSGAGEYSIHIAEMCSRGFYMIKATCDNKQYDKKIVVVR
jgi:endoglucanase